MTNAKPLAGVKVLELARILAGPWCGQLLADLGAEVIKVERPGVGDDTRAWGPPFVADAKGGVWGSAYYHACNRGKRSLAVDFESEDGRATIRRLAGECDVVIENFKVGGLAKFGLDAASLRAAFPRLVYCSISGFGQDGPYAERAGYDYVIQGMSGLMDITGEPGREPQKVGVAVVDLFTGVYASTAILAALRKRDRDGIGAHIDVALMDCAVAHARQPGDELSRLRPLADPARQRPPQHRALPGVRRRRRPCRRRGRQRPAVPQSLRRDRRRGGRRRTGFRDQSAARRQPRSPDRCADAASCRLHPRGAAGEARSGGRAGGADQPHRRRVRRPQVVHRGMRLDLVGDDGAKVAGVASPIVIDGVRMTSRPSEPAPRRDGGVAAGASRPPRPSRRLLSQAPQDEEACHRTHALILGAPRSGASRKERREAARLDEPALGAANG